ncbi:MAG: AMP-binding protein [Nocardioidaceae bacterium]
MASPTVLPDDPSRVFATVQRWWAEADGPLLVRTSGSTGTPKAVLLSRTAFAASTSGTHARIGGPGQWLLALPPAYVAGVNVLIRSLVAGTSPVVADLAELEQGVDAMDSERRYAAVVPTQLHRLAEQGRLSPLSRLDAVLVGGAALRPALADRVRAAGVRVVRTYGMSETCGGCVYDGVPLDGVRVRIGADARVELAGPMLFDGYADEPRGKAAGLRDSWFVTSDLGHLDGSGRLHVLGRADDVAVSGGVNVPLAAVTDAVLAMPGVRDAVAVGVPDDEWGQRVVAVVVGAAPALVALREHVAQSLGRRDWAPKAVVRVDALPLLPNGKLDRVSVRHLAAGAPSSTEESTFGS